MFIAPWFHADLNSRSHKMFYCYFFLFVVVLHFIASHIVQLDFATYCVLHALLLVFVVHSEYEVHNHQYHYGYDSADGYPHFYSSEINLVHDMIIRVKPSHRDNFAIPPSLFVFEHLEIFLHFDTFRLDSLCLGSVQTVTVCHLASSDFG